MRNRLRYKLYEAMLSELPGYRHMEPDLASAVLDLAAAAWEHSNIDNPELFIMRCVAIGWHRDWIREARELVH